jgi:hypothetical protein
MKRIELKYLFLVLAIFAVICISTNEASAQSRTLLNKLVEKPHVITDRDVYCVGEKILFSTFDLSSAELRDTEWSNILYVEIITPDGESISQKKYDYRPDDIQGVIPIPRWTLTGNYYLRAYTRWMRDFSPHNYFYKMITIINPLRSTLLEPTDDEVIKERDTFETPANSKLIDIHIPAHRPVFDKREEIELEVRTENPEKFREKMIVSVVPKGSARHLQPVIKRSSNFNYTPELIPETRGVSVSGKVVDTNDSIPLPYTLVALTIFNEQPENLNVIADQEGRFFFDLSYLKGEYELFISAKVENDSLIPLILVDNDFSTARIALPYVPVDLSGESNKLYQNLNFNSQMQALYSTQGSKEIADSNQLTAFSSDSTFYGDPDFLLKMDDYIKLPSLSDYFRELVPQVKVRKKDNNKVLKIVGLNPEMWIYDPLILMDMVSIFDVEKVLALPPEKIQRIEVILSPFVRGNVTYGGIVSFFSRKGDLAGIDLPSAGRFINYRMLSENGSKIADKNLTGKHIPDLRNCLYWNPAVQFNETGSAKIRFSTGDNSGDYTIVVHAVDQNGAVNLVTKEIRID